MKIKDKISKLNLELSNASPKGRFLNFMDIFSNLPAKITKKKRFYITENSLRKVKKDYEDLKLLKLAKTTGKVPQFFHSDDLDPEYLDFQDDVTSLDAKLAELEYIIKNAEIIKPPPKQKRNIVQVGARVLVDIDGHEDEFTILGSLEANPSLGIISYESPVGKVLLGKKIGEEAVLNSPVRVSYKIKKIRYL